MDISLPLADGVIFGILPQLVPASVLTTIGLASPTRVLRGNADAGGALTYSDVTVDANKVSNVEFESNGTSYYRVSPQNQWV